MKRHIRTAAFLLALAAFTGYVAMDTFVLRETWQENAGAVNTELFTASEDMPAASSPAAEDVSPAQEESASPRRLRSRSGPSSGGGTEKGSSGAAEEAAAEEAGQGDGSIVYEDGDIRIVLTEFEENGTRVYAAEIELSSVQYLKTAFAQDVFGRNVTDKTSVIAGEHDAILAVNGDYYSAREAGIVIRNGVVYRDTSGDSDVLCLFADGSMEVFAPGEATAGELAARGAWQAFCFGPGLVENGAVTVSENDEVGRAKASNPRTAIGMIEPGRYLLVVSDGRTDESEGLTLRELAEVMQHLGAVTAYNLDGGGSSTMVLNGSIVNYPTTGGSFRERSVSDIVYIG